MNKVIIAKHKCDHTCDHINKSKKKEFQDSLLESLAKSLESKYVEMQTSLINELFDYLGVSREEISKAKLKLTDQQIQLIKRIINKNFNMFLLSTLGANSLNREDLYELQKLGLLNYLMNNNLFRDAFKMGKERKGPQSELIPDTYEKWRSKRYNDYFTAIDNQAMDEVAKSSEFYTKKFKDNVTNKLLSKILESNREAIRTNAGPVSANSQKKITEPLDRKELAKELEQQTKNSFMDWERIVSTELNAAYSQGAVHAILEDNKHKDPNDILVYMQGPLDAGTCKWCKKFYHDGNSFKVYRLVDLLENGTNVGRKAADWQAVIPPMHPRCRHRVVELAQGFSLNSNGQVYFVDKYHHELDNPMIKKSLQYKVPTFSGWKLQDRYTYQGMKISVERKKGTYRTWEDRNGKSGKTLMHYDYGYIRNTLGSDGDHVDCYVGPDEEAKYVFIVHQLVPDTGKHDEEKVMLGFNTYKEAKEAYLKHYNSDKFFGGMTMMHIEKFKRKVLGKETDIIKAAKKMAGSHKYVKRTGSPGNYKYWYKLPNGQLVEGDDAPEGHVHKNEINETSKKSAKTLTIVNSSKEFEEIKPDSKQHKASQLDSMDKLSGDMIEALNVWTSGAGGKGADDNPYSIHAHVDNKDEVANHYVLRDIQIGNENLHNPKAVESGKRILANLDKEFKNLPVYNGTIYRGINSSKIPMNKKVDFFRSLKEGGEITVDSYSSFTADKKVAQSFGDVLFVVQNNTSGRDISFADESGYQNEVEVLVPKNVKYKITKIERDNKGIPTCYLEEVTSNISKKVVVRGRPKGSKNKPKVVVKNKDGVMSKENFIGQADAQHVPSGEIDLEHENNYRLNNLQDIKYYVKDGKVTGHLGIGEDSDTGVPQIKAVYVDPDNRRSGIALAMYKDYIENNDELISDDADAMEPEAKNLWEKLRKLYPTKIQKLKDGRYYYSSKNEKNKNLQLQDALQFWSREGYSDIRKLQGAPTHDYENDKSGYMTRESDIPESDEVERHLKTMEEGFDTLPTYDGPIARGLNLEPENLEKFLKILKPGKIYEIEAFSSFSQNKVNPDFQGNLHLIVEKNKSGKQIAKFSDYDDEGEVLVKKGTKYKIKNVDLDDFHNGMDGRRKRYIVTLEEVDDE